MFFQNAQRNRGYQKHKTGKPNKYNTLRPKHRTIKHKTIKKSEKLKHRNTTTQKNRQAKTPEYIKEGQTRDVKNPRKQASWYN